MISDDLPPTPQLPAILPSFSIHACFSIWYITAHLLHSPLTIKPKHDEFRYRGREMPRPTFTLLHTICTYASAEYISTSSAHDGRRFPHQHCFTDASKRQTAAHTRAAFCRRGMRAARAAPRLFSAIIESGGAPAVSSLMMLYILMRAYFEYRALPLAL